MSKVNNVDNNHCVKSARIRRYSRLYFPVFGLNNSEYGHFSRSENHHFSKDLPFQCQ